MDKEAVVHIYNGILHNHKKVRIWDSSTEMDKPRACYTEWSKLETENQILFINPYTWNLEKLYWWTYLQSRTRETYVETRLVDTAGEGEAGINRKSNTKYVYYHV